MITRTLKKTIVKGLKPGFINIIYGPRRVGKTTLLKQITQDISAKDILWLNGDTQETRDILSNTSEAILSDLVKNSSTVVIDEAQRVKNIGLSLKILIDKYPKKTFYISGSSSIMLSRGIKESLTGRNLTYKLYPLSTEELSVDIPNHQKSSLIEQQLIYGGYPYLTHTSNSKEKQEYLKSIINDYLFKDVLELKSIEHPDNLKKLATLLAFQIGSQVSYNELANTLNLDVKTIIKYISYLKQSYIIFELSSFSRNLRSELSKSKKYYFWDLGIRNSLTGLFQTLDSRADTGHLLENFLVLERLKKQHYQRQETNNYFWRTYTKAEIDWIEVEGNKLSAFEFKWSFKKEAKVPKEWSDTYPNATFESITQKNYLPFIS
jgi:uncharacterized protein